MSLKPLNSSSNANLLIELCFIKKQPIELAANHLFNKTLDSLN
jgi:hypothetical protein